MKQLIDQIPFKYRGTLNGCVVCVPYNGCSFDELEFENVTNDVSLKKLFSADFVLYEKGHLFQIFKEGDGVDIYIRHNAFQLANIMYSGSYREIDDIIDLTTKKPVELYYAFANDFCQFDDIRTTDFDPDRLVRRELIDGKFDTFYVDGNIVCAYKYNSDTHELELCNTLLPIMMYEGVSLNEIDCNK